MRCCHGIFAPVPEWFEHKGVSSFPVILLLPWIAMAHTAEVAQHLSAVCLEPFLLIKNVRSTREADSILPQCHGLGDSSRPGDEATSDPGCHESDDPIAFPGSLPNLRFANRECENTAVNARSKTGIVNQ